MTEAVQKGRHPVLDALIFRTRKRDLLILIQSGDAGSASGMTVLMM